MNTTNVSPVESKKSINILLLIFALLAALAFLWLAVVVVGAALFGGVATYAVSRNLDRDPAAVKTIAAEIVDLQLPAGFEPDYASQMLGFSLAAYDPNDDQSHLILLQAPERIGFDQNKLEEQMEQMVPNNGGSRKDDVLVLAQIPVTIRGDATTLVISEATNSDGQTYRVANVIFPGKGGPALLSFERPVDQWDVDTLDALIKSIR